MIVFIEEDEEMLVGHRNIYLFQDDDSLPGRSIFLTDTPKLSSLSQTHSRLRQAISGRNHCSAGKSATPNAALAQNERLSPARK